MAIPLRSTRAYLMVRKLLKTLEPANPEAWRGFPTNTEPQCQTFSSYQIMNPPEDISSLPLKVQLFFATMGTPGKPCTLVDYDATTGNLVVYLWLVGPHWNSNHVSNLLTNMDSGQLITARTTFPLHYFLIIVPSTTFGIPTVFVPSRPTI